MGARAERDAAGIAPNRKRRCYQRRSGAPTREPAHFDWRWRERPALALLAWEALGSRSAGEATPHSSGVNWNDNLILGAFGSFVM